MSRPSEFAASFPVAILDPVRGQVPGKLRFSLKIFDSMKELNQSCVLFKSVKRVKISKNYPAGHINVI